MKNIIIAIAIIIFFSGDFGLLNHSTLRAEDSDTLSPSDIPDPKNLPNGLFIRPNEYRPDFIEKLFKMITFKGKKPRFWVTVGTERGWISTDPDKFEYLLFVDNDLSIHWFNMLNELLIRHSPDIESYRRSRFSDDYNIWKEHLPDDHPLVSEADFKLWKRKHRKGSKEINPLDALKVPPDQRGNIHEKYDQILPNDYIWNEAKFLKLKSMVESNKVFHMKADLSKPEGIKKINAFVESKKAETSVLDTSNVRDYIEDINMDQLGRQIKISEDGFFIETIFLPFNRLAKLKNDALVRYLITPSKLKLKSNIYSFFREIIEDNNFLGFLKNRGDKDNNYFIKPDYKTENNLSEFKNKCN